MSLPVTVGIPEGLLSAPERSDLVDAYVVESQRVPASAQSGECVICMTECVVRVTTCGHPFCTPCLTRYAEVSRATVLPCPMCRRPLSGDDLPRDARSALAININVPPSGTAPQDFVVLDDERRAHFATRYYEGRCASLQPSRPCSLRRPRRGRL
jgi:hypothetical protein